MEIDPSNKQAASIVRGLEPKVKERREKLKEEMFGKSWAAWFRGGNQLAASFSARCERGCSVCGLTYTT